MAVNSTWFLCVDNALDFYHPVKEHVLLLVLFVELVTTATESKCAFPSGWGSSSHPVADGLPGSRDVSYQLWLWSPSLPQMLLTLTLGFFSYSLIHWRLKDRHALWNIMEKETERRRGTVK